MGKSNINIYKWLLSIAMLNYQRVGSQGELTIDHQQVDLTSFK